MQLLAQQKRRVAELEEEVRQRDGQIGELLSLTEQQANTNIEARLELVQLKATTKLELELEAANRLRQVLLNEK